MFSATPLQDASLATNAILVVATVFQLGIAISYGIRGRSPHLLPSIAAIFAFLLLFISYALGVAYFLVSFITDDFGVPLVSFQVILNIETASSLFSGWADPALFLVVVFVIRDRYLAYDGRGPNGEKSGLTLLLFMIISYFLAFMMIVLSSASAGLFHAAVVSNISVDSINAKITISNRLFYALIAFYMLATIWLIPFAFVVKQNANSDRMNNATLFGIIPLLCVRAIARMILVIIRAQNETFSSINEDAFTLADITSTGFFYLAAISILCYFFSVIHLWRGTGDPTPQQGPQQPLHGGFQPFAQSPGQWGIPGMQPQQGYVTPNIGYYPNQLFGHQYMQQYMQEPYQPNQRPPVIPGPGPAETPGEEKHSKPIGSHPYATQPNTSDDT